MTIPEDAAAAKLRPRTIMHALIAAMAAGRPVVGAELLADFLVEPTTPQRGTVIAEVVPLLAEALDPLVFGGLVERTALEGAVVVYSVRTAELARLISTGLTDALVRLGLEEGPAPVAPMPRRPGLRERFLSGVEHALVRVQRTVTASRRRRT